MLGPWRPPPHPSRPVPRSPRRAALPLPPLLKWQLPLICHIPWLGSPSLRLLPRPCSPAPLAKIEKGQHLSILAESLGGDPGFLPPLPLLWQCHWIRAERDPDGMWRERTPSCFLQRKTPGRSQPFRAPELPSQQTAEVRIPASLITTNPPCPESCKHIKIPLLSLGPCLCPGQCGSWTALPEGFSFGHPVGATTRRAPGSEQSGTGCAGCCLAIPGRGRASPSPGATAMPRHLAPAALTRGYKSA